jgi:hypothetical protein
MAYVKGEVRCQGTLFPVFLGDLIPADQMCRVINAFAGHLTMEKLALRDPRR